MTRLSNHRLIDERKDQPPLQWDIIAHIIFGIHRRLMRACTACLRHRFAFGDEKRPIFVLQELRRGSAEPRRGK